MKSLLFFLLLLQPLFSSDQILLVVAKEFTSAQALLQRYERHDQHYVPVGRQIRVNLGRNGLGWGRGITEIAHANDEPVKHEGDGKAPAGIFNLERTFGYAAQAVTAMPYLQARPELICVDDSDSPHYNRITSIDRSKVLKSFEWMKRDDAQYSLGITVAHNRLQEKEAGSCIFLHVEKGEGLPTAGCTSMHYRHLSEIISWLEPSKEPLLIQLPRAYCDPLAGKFPGIRCP